MRSQQGRNASTFVRYHTTPPFHAIYIYIYIYICIVIRMQANTLQRFIYKLLLILLMVLLGFFMRGNLGPTRRWWVGFPPVAVLICRPILVPARNAKFMRCVGIGWAIQLLLVLWALMTICTNAQQVSVHLEQLRRRHCGWYGWVVRRQLPDRLDICMLQVRWVVGMGGGFGTRQLLQRRNQHWSQVKNSVVKVLSKPQRRNTKHIYRKKNL